MRDRSPSLLIVALVAFAGLFHFVPSTSSPRGQTEAAPAGRGIASRFGADDSALKLLAQHYALERDENCPERPRPASPPPQQNANTSEADEGLDPCVKRATIEKFQADSGSKVLFALVPDPIDSRGTYKFDEALEALQSGANDSGYLMDRFSLPWPRHALGPDSEQQKSADLEAFRSKPGVLLFRRGSVVGSSEGLLVVFVIGEIPTSGVQIPALLSALQQAKDLRGGPGEVRIIGPQFSGAAASLETALRRWAQTLQGSQTVVVHFISANATNSGARERIDKIESLPLKVEFHATVLPDDVIDTAMKVHFSRMNIDRSAIAILAESDSAYGQGVIAGDEKPSDDGWARYRLPYPMHVSQVQTRYQREHVQETQPLNIGEDPVHASLHLSLDDAEDPRDKPQLFAPGPSANVAELSLTAILQTLNREHINYVGLSGTDVRDKLFLARLIRSQFPNVQFFTDDSDILYAHPDYQSDLWGMLIFSTYPLASQSQTWTIPAGSRANLRQFSSQTAESIHHATKVALRDRLDNLEKYFMIKDDAGELEDYNICLRPAGPVVWITAVGHGGLWPVNVFDPWNGSARSRDRLAEVNIQVPNAFVWVVVLLGTFGLGTWSLYVRAQWPRNRKQRVATMFPTPTDGFVLRFVLRLYLISLVFIFSLLLWVTFLPPLAYTAEPTALQALQAVAVAMLLPMINAIHLAYARDKTFSKQLLWKTMAQDVVVLGFVLAVLAFAAYRTSFVDRIMLFERATRFSSGVSPILPLLFLCVGTSAWVICFLSQVRVIRHAEHTRPFSEAPDTPAGEGLRAIQQKIHNAMNASYVLRSPQIEDYVVWGLTALALVAGLFVPFFKTFEYLDHGRRLAGFGIFDAILLVFFVALCGLLCWSARDFLVTTYQLGRLLRRLTFHRLLPAFRRMSPKSSHGLSTNLLASTPMLAELQEPYDQLIDIRNAFTPINELELEAGDQIFPQDLDRSVRKISLQLRAEFKREGAETGTSFAFRSESQGELSSVGAGLLESLGKYWEGESPALKDLSPDIRKDVDHAFELCENFVATQVVVYLNSVFLYLRYCLICASTALLFLLLATSAYPYSRQNLMMNFAWFLLLSFFCVYLYVFMQFERNEALRAIRTDKGEEGFFNRTVVSQILLFGVIPALVFLGTKFPSLGRLLFAWTGPLLKAFNLSR